MSATEVVLDVPAAHRVDSAQLDELVALPVWRLRKVLAYVQGYAPGALTKALARHGERAVDAAAPSVDWAALRKCPVCAAPTNMPCRVGVTGGQYEQGGALLRLPHRSRKLRKR